MRKRWVSRVVVALSVVAIGFCVLSCLGQLESAMHAPPAVLDEIKRGMTFEDVQALIGRKCDEFGGVAGIPDAEPWGDELPIWHFPTGRIGVLIDGAGRVKWAKWRPWPRRRMANESGFSLWTRLAVLAPALLAYGAGFVFIICRTRRSVRRSLLALLGTCLLTLAELVLAVLPDAVLSIGIGSGEPEQSASMQKGLTFAVSITRGLGFAALLSAALLCDGGQRRDLQK